MKSIFLVLGFCTITSLTSMAQKSSSDPLARKWWATLLVDAGGALGGAASAAQLCPHPLCLAGGGILGGAAASLARNPSATIAETNGGVIALPKNSTFPTDVEAIGAKHNQVILDYYKTYPTYSLDKYWAFISANHTRYGISKLPFSKANLVEILRVANVEVNTTEGASAYLESIIPKNFTTRNDFKNTALSILALTNIPELNSKCVTIENNFLSSRTIPENEKLMYQYFFTVIRASGNLWK